MYIQPHSASPSLICAQISGHRRVRQRVLMPDPISLTFKVSPEFNLKICEEMGIHDLNRSDFVRQCIRVASPLLRECPALLAADDKRIEEIMRKGGKILVTLEVL